MSKEIPEEVWKNKGKLSPSLFGSVQYDQALKMAFEALFEVVKDCDYALMCLYSDGKHNLDKDTMTHIQTIVENNRSAWRIEDCPTKTKLSIVLQSETEADSTLEYMNSQFISIFEQQGMTSAGVGPISILQPKIISKDLQLSFKECMDLEARRGETVRLRAEKRRQDQESALKGDYEYVPTLEEQAAGE